MTVPNRIPFEIVMSPTQLAAEYLSDHVLTPSEIRAEREAEAISGAIQEFETGRDGHYPPVCLSFATR